MKIVITKEERKILINVFEFLKYLNDIVQKHEVG